LNARNKEQKALSLHRGEPYLSHLEPLNIVNYSDSKNLLRSSISCTKYFWIQTSFRSIFLLHNNPVFKLNANEIKQISLLPSYEIQAHVNLAAACICLCFHIWKAAAYELVDERMESGVSSYIHTSSNTRPVTTCIILLTIRTDGFELPYPFNLQPTWFSWTFLMAHSKAKLKSSVDKAYLCFRPF
jgi:hypothetical protein